MDSDLQRQLLQVILKTRLLLCIMIMPVISARISLHWHSCCSFFQVQTTSWPPCTCSTPPFRDLLPGHCAALAAIVHPHRRRSRSSRRVARARHPSTGLEHPRRRRPGLGRAAGWQTLAVIALPRRRAPSSRTPVAVGPASAWPAAPAVLPVACIDIEIGRWLVTAWAGLALVGRAGPFQKKGGNIFRPEVPRDNKSIQLER